MGQGNRNNMFHNGKNPEDEENRRFSAPKGQWFLISAVIASGIFLAISILLRDYFAVPAASTGPEQLYLDGIRSNAISVVKKECARQGGSLTDRENLTEYIHFATQQLGSMGYLANITPKASIDCSKGMENFHVILVRSMGVDTWDGERPEITMVEPEFAGGRLASYRIRFDSPVGYGFFINASVYGTAGFVNSEIHEVPAGSSFFDAVFGVDIPQSANMYTIIYSTHLIGKRRWELM